MSNDWLSAKEAAERLGRSPKTLERWRADDCGPPAYRAGGLKRGRVRYRASEIDAWLAARRITRQGEPTRRPLSARPPWQPKHSGRAPSGNIRDEVGRLIASFSGFTRLDAEVLSVRLLDAA